MAGSIQPNEMTSDAKLLRKSRSAGDSQVEVSSAGAGGMSGFSSQLSGLMEAVSIEVEAAPVEREAVEAPKADDSNSDREEASDAKAEENAQESSDTNNGDQGRESAPVVETPTLGQEAPALADAAPLVKQEAASPTAASEEAPLPSNTGEAVEVSPDTEAGSEDLSDAVPELAQDLEVEGEAAPEIDADADLASDVEVDAEQAPELESDEASVESTSDENALEVEAEGPETLASKPNEAKTAKTTSADKNAAASAQNADASDSAIETTDAPEPVDSEAGAEEAPEQASGDAPEFERSDSADEGDTLRSERLDRQSDETQASDDAPERYAELDASDLEVDAQPSVEEELTSRNSGDLANTNPMNDAVATQVAAASAASAAAASMANTSPSASGAENAGPAATSASASASNADGANNQNQQGMGEGQNNGDSAQRTRAAKPLRLSKTMQNRQIEVVRQISKNIGLRSATRADGNLKLMLAPEALGTISLELSFGQNGELSIEGVTQNDATRHLLSGSIDELRQALRQENIELARFTMSERHGESFSSDTSSAQDQQAGSGQRRAPAGNNALSGANLANEETSTDRGSEDASVKLGALDLQA